MGKARQANPLLEKRPSLKTPAQMAQSAVVFKCKLLTPPDKIFGFDDKIQNLALNLRDGSSQLAVVVGGPGMGVTSFANAVGRLLYDSGNLNGGAYYANLLGCSSREKATDR